MGTIIRKCPVRVTGFCSCLRECIGIVSRDCLDPCSAFDLAAAEDLHYTLRHICHSRANGTGVCPSIHKKKCQAFWHEGFCGNVTKSPKNKQEPTWPLESHPLNDYLSLQLNSERTADPCRPRVIDPRLHMLNAAPTLNGTSKRPAVLTCPIVAPAQGTIKLCIYVHSRS